MNKRGLSAVIISLILILLAIVVSGVLWVVISNVVQTGSEGITLEGFFLDLQIENVKVESNGDVSITVKRGAGDADLTGINFVVSDGLNSKVIEEPTSLQELGTSTFTISQAELTGIISVKEVSIAPIITEDEQEKTGRVADEEIFSFKSCLDILNRDFSDGNGTYIIDPEGENFEVFCDMTTDGGGWTGLSHDSEARTHVIGFETPGSYSREINYNQTLNLMTNMLDGATSVKQYLFYECKGSVLRTDGGASAFGWWTDRADNKMTYWPNGNANCEINDLVWREDGGFVTAKGELPITSVKFGDTGQAGEEGYHTVGKVWVR